VAIRVLLADDSDVVRRAISRLLEQDPEIEVVGEAVDFTQTIQMTNDLKPEVVILDLHMKDDVELSPGDIKARLNHAPSRILAISIWNDAESKALAESVGAITLLDKMDLVTELIPTIKQTITLSN
jgi:two-component system, NarL family, invasion response regulator UvrY